jgi:hypothetical protein
MRKGYELPCTSLIQAAKAKSRLGRACHGSIKPDCTPIFEVNPGKIFVEQLGPEPPKHGKFSLGGRNGPK